MKAISSVSVKALGLLFLVAALEGVAVLYMLKGGELGLNDFRDPEILKILGVGVMIGWVINVMWFENWVGRKLRRIEVEIEKLIRGEKYRRHKFEEEDEIGVIGRFFNEITRQIERIARDLKNAERLSGEIGLAAKIQSDVLPKKAPVIPGVEMIAKTRSAAEMGGDSFDFLQSGDQTVFYIGDVTGHGVAAGLVMMMVNILVRAFEPLHRKTDEIFKRVNKVLFPRIAANMFMTLTSLRWQHNDRKLYYTGCGHEYLLHYKAETGKCEKIKSGGIALGMIHDNSKIIKEQEIDFKENDLVVLYTDGITEARNENGEMYEIERLQAALEKYGQRETAESVFNNLTDDFSRFVGKYEDQKDDITLIVLKNRGASYQQEAVKLVVNNPVKSKSEVWSW